LNRFSPFGIPQNRSICVVLFHSKSPLNYSNKAMLLLCFVLPTGGCFSFA
jgi:hypothetical protein